MATTTLASWNRTTAKSKSKTPAGSSSGPFVRSASQIIPRLYLSDLQTAQDATALTRHGITHVISVIEREPNIPDIVPNERHMHIPLADRDDVDILGHFKATTDFIRAALAENATNRVLVHCFMGISRSATVVCAYVVATSGMTAHEAIDLAQSKRGIVSPNLGFRVQLEEYALRFVGAGKAGGGGIPRLKISAGIGSRIRMFKFGASSSSPSPAPAPITPAPEMKEVEVGKTLVGSTRENIL